MSRQALIRDCGRVEGRPTSIDVLGVPFACDSLASAVENAMQAIRGTHDRVIVSFGNPHSVIVARRDHMLRKALLNSTYVLPDGIGIALAAYLLGKRISGRITGWDFFEHMMQALERRGGGRVFFFGSSDLVLQKIARRLEREYQNVKLCGHLSPPYGAWTEAENDAFVDEIRACRPDILWVGMTAPKQECWVEGVRERLQVPVIGSIGAVFDFYAGTCSRAPHLIRLLGLEWVYRLIHSPRRMWRRTFISGIAFIGLTIRQAMDDILLARSR